MDFLYSLYDKFVFTLRPSDMIVEINGHKISHFFKRQPPTNRRRVVCESKKLEEFMKNELDELEENNRKCLDIRNGHNAFVKYHKELDDIKVIKIV